MLKMLKIAALPNGAHDNQDFHGELPDGWAIIPEDMETPNFPFGEVEAELLPFGEPDPETEEVPQVMTVTKWTAGEVPEVTEPDREPTTAELLDTLLGVTDHE